NRKLSASSPSAAASARPSSAAGVGALAARSRAPHPHDVLDRRGRHPIPPPEHVEVHAGPAEPPEVRQRLPPEQPWPPGTVAEVRRIEAPRPCRARSPDPTAARLDPVAEQPYEPPGRNRAPFDGEAHVARAMDGARPG